jgi:peptide/nickel transport system permease protein
LLPLITVVGVQIGNLLAYSVITETVFQWPGLSKLFIDAVQFADVPVLSAYFLMVAALFVTINFTIDVIYMLIDPRVRAGAIPAAQKTG